MPRPKVKPENRQRSTRACLPCKNSKIRCDAQLPCSGCVRRDRVSSCRYIDSPNHGRTNSISGSSNSNLLHHRNDPSSGASRNISSEAEHPLLGGTNGHTPALEADVNGQSHGTWPPSAQLTKSRMLLSSKGEKVYVGETSLLAFLHFLRRTLRQHMGLTPFTESITNVMLEAEMDEARFEANDEDDVDQKRSLVQCYFDATSAILDLYEKTDILDYLSEFQPSPSDFTHFKNRRHDLAALFLIIAIGGQCRGASSSDLKLSSTYFSKGQQIAFEGMLNDPSIDMVRLFLLMAFYMLGACRRNAAFMYLGVASKAATALGLHMTGLHKNMPKGEYDIRMRTWKSLRILDLNVNALLGRPNCLPSSRSDPGNSSVLDQNYNTASPIALDANYEACTFLDDIFSRFCKGNRVESSWAEQILQRLRDWSQSLSLDLRHFTKQGPIDITVADREVLIGNIHVACVYYFAVILVTRPFLISHLMSQLRGKSSETDIPPNATEREKIAKFSQVCIDSAIFMAQMTHNAMKSGLLLNNMSILKAWMFGVGLILGFSLFVQGSAIPEVEESYAGVRAVLKKFADLSPQARQYYDILTSLSETINKHQQQVMDERRLATNQYLDKIFTIDVTETNGQAFSADLPTLMDDVTRDADQLFDMRTSTVTSPMMNLPVLWDDFNIDYEPLGIFFEGLG